MIKKHSARVKIFCSLFLVIAGWPPRLSAQQFWQKVTLPAKGRMAQQFQTIPSVYGQTVTWGWNGEVNRETIGKDLDSLKSHGLLTASIEAGYNMPGAYLSETWFKLITIAVEEARKRDMHLWIIDEGKYPSGFAGGKFSEEKPELRMQGLVVAERFEVKEAEQISRKLPVGVISAIALNKTDSTNMVLPVTGASINWKAPAGNWEVLLIQHRFKTSVTRSANNPKRGKDTLHSLCDYLNPEATRAFLQFTHEQYKKHVGHEFGKTILGFRGDEPDYGFTPWTPKLPEEFLKRKGYDIVPYLGIIFATKRTVEQQQIKADFWDVWSAMFAENFFKIQADWCIANHMEYMVHLNHEEKMMDLVRSSGDFFRNMRYVGIPGVDAIWLQIWPDKVADFPKLASSAAHLFGRPRSLSESFAAYTIPPSVPQAKWVINYQLVRGINLFEYMFWSGGAQGVPAGYLGRQEFIPVAKYSNRASYLLANGIPAAKVALYHPTGNMWMGDENSNSKMLGLARQLSEKQIDYDFVDDQALADVLKLSGKTLVNMSGQTYTTVIIPPLDYLTKDVYNRLLAFQSAGGKVMFSGNLPGHIVDRTYRKAMTLPVAELTKNNGGNNEAQQADAAKSAGNSEITAIRTTSGTSQLVTTGIYLIKSDKLDQDALQYIGTSDVVLERPAPAVKYLHRHWKDAELYFFFNEGEQPTDIMASLTGSGKAESWDAATGQIKGIPATKVNAHTIKLRLNLAAHQTMFIVTGKATEKVAPTSKDFYITDFGAKADSSVINTAAIQKCIDHCAAAGGGTVIIPEGTFYSGAIFLKKKVSLSIHKNGRLKGTLNQGDYPLVRTRWEGEEKEWYAALVNAIDLQGFSISGEGTIDGSGEVWKQRGGRPRLIAIQNCSRVKVNDLNLQNQASWGLFVLYSANVKIDGLKITAEHHIPSSDGIDIDSSVKIHISNTFIDVNDDCISIKSGKDEDGLRVNRPSENILIEKCHFAYGHGGVAMGSETSGGIRKVEVRDCIADAGNWAPIRFKSQPSRGGIVEDITYRNIRIDGTRKAFEFNMAWRMVNPKPAAKVLPIVRNIRLINVSGTADAVGDISGIEGSPVTGVTFTNCSITAKKGLLLRHTKDIDQSGLTVTFPEN